MITILVVLWKLESSRPEAPGATGTILWRVSKVVNVLASSMRSISTSMSTSAASVDSAT